MSKPATAAAADDVERVLALLSDPSTEDEGIVQAAELLGYQPDADDDADAVAASLALLLDYPEMMSRGNGKQGTNQLIAQADALLKQAGAGGKALRTTPPAAPPAKRADVPAIPNDGTRKERWDAAAEGAIPSGSKSPLVKAEHLGGGMVRKDGVISPPSIARRLARTRRVAALVGAGVDVKRACEVAGLGRGWIAKALRAYRDYLDGEPIADTDANYDLLRAGELVERTYSFAALMRDFPDQSLLDRVRRADQLPLELARQARHDARRDRADAWLDDLVAERATERKPPTVVQAVSVNVSGQQSGNTSEEPPVEGSAEVLTEEG